MDSLGTGYMCSLPILYDAQISIWRMLEPFAAIRILVGCNLSVSSPSVDTMDLCLTFLQSQMGQHTYHNKLRDDPLKMDFT